MHWKVGLQSLYSTCVLQSLSTCLFAGQTASVGNSSTHATWRSQALSRSARSVLIRLMYINCLIRIDGSSSRSKCSKADKQRRMYFNFCSIKLLSRAKASMSNIRASKNDWVQMYCNFKHGTYIYLLSNGRHSSTKCVPILPNQTSPRL